MQDHDVQNAILRTLLAEAHRKLVLAEAHVEALIEDRRRGADRLS